METATSRYKGTGPLTFADQAAKYLEQSANRKRTPVRPATLRRYREIVETHLNPKIGSLRLQSVGNKVVKELGAELAQAGLSPATIQLISIVIKQIRASAINEDGEQLYPYKWNAEFMDLPVVTGQKQAVIALESLKQAIWQAPFPDNALYAILAGTGLRIAEALALQTIDTGLNVWLPAEALLIVRGQLTRNGFGPTKTSAGVRQVDIAPELNNFLTELFKDPLACLFPNSESYYYKRALKFNIPGFHSLRRFRETHLERMNCPRMLMKFWTGHAAADITERYIKVGSEIDTRKSEAARIGLGF